MSNSDLMRARDVAEYFGCSLPNVYTMIRQNRIPVVRMGRSVLVSRKALEQWIEEESRTPRARPVRSGTRQDQTVVDGKAYTVKVLEQSMVEYHVDALNETDARQAVEAMLDDPRLGPADGVVGEVLSAVIMDVQAP